MAKRILLTFLLIISLLITLNTPVQAKENFSVNSATEYKFFENGTADITNTVTIKNTSSQFFAKDYTLTLSGVSPKNIKATDSKGKLSTFTLADNDVTKVRIEFPEPLTGMGKSRTFVVTYEDSTLAQKSGDVWEIYVPKLTNPESFNEYEVVLSLPQAYGEEAYISPDPRASEKDNNRLIYTFLKEDLESAGITAGFGNFQVFSYTLNYHIENTSNKKTVQTIAIPPDTSTQKMHYQDIVPQPDNVYQDEDGNWLATFTLSPRQKKDIEVSGYVQIFAIPRRFIKPSGTTLLENTKPTSFWQSDNSVIQELAKNLKTPEEIYNFVTKNLSYNYDKIRPNAERLGAKHALEYPSDSICTEFTDLFIALARAAGIPAREINGYAYSENPKIQPLSLVSDVLHAWPEYWDSKKGTWIPVDPTWGSTSGIDYFNKFDLRHFAFVIHGKKPDFPSSPAIRKKTYMYLSQNFQKLKIPISKLRQHFLKISSFFPKMLM